MRLPVVGRIAGMLAVLLVVGAEPRPAAAASLASLAVDVVNQSEPVLCAEKDNVALAFSSDRARRFKIEAAHPAYSSSIDRDSFAADWTACTFEADPAHAAAVTEPTRRTLYEEPELWVVGWTFPTFWRPSTAKVVIGGDTFEGLHLIQVWMIRPMGGEEVLVVYPQDGYWRIRPKAPAGRAPTAFGTSFLVGPVEDAGRPIVALDRLAFDPATRTFALEFAKGGRATVAMTEVTADRHVLDVTFDTPVAGGPFAMLRSMYVTEFNNDVARVAVRENGAPGWREAPVMGFDKAHATDLWAGRTTPSRHNTSSPDMVLKGFRE